LTDLINLIDWIDWVLLGFVNTILYSDVRVMRRELLFSYYPVFTS